ncbi:biofilm regulation protein phosphatase SiaA [Oceanisphaera sp. W20_SRM_FM3]|uniref:biofilm regulation protein phosphatase SiaA n=1 Tax=Oceanisphaera sp. W20_SRM_FM3 TaxID=3240267 RepID=UPI003F9828DA
MATWGKGLRAKAVWAVIGACLLIFIPAAAMGWQLVSGVQEHFGRAFALNFTQLNRQNILVPLSRDLALAQRFADSILMQQWLSQEDNPQDKALLFRESEGYLKDFSSHSFFIISTQSGAYYYREANKAFDGQPEYTLKANNPDDSWFYNVLANGQQVNINVNRDARLQTTRVWLNILIEAQGKVLGMAGTGIDLTQFIEQFIATDEVGVTPMIIDEQGAFQAHPDKDTIAIGSAAGAEVQQRTLLAQLPEAQQARLRTLMAEAKKNPQQVSLDHFTLADKRQLVALSFIPELSWYVVTAIDLDAAQILEPGWLTLSLLAFILILVLLLLALAYAVERLMLLPLRRLQSSASAIANGNYQVSLPPSTGDEIGDLSTAFGVMANKVQTHTQELENKVRSRTCELEAANQQMRQAHQQINDSIDYASLIQKAILPDQQLKQTLGEQHFVLWHPRDVVGGDFYVFHPAEHGRYLVGVVDCAGHGVAGALMTMLARAALDHAIHDSGIASPATILQQTDLILRGMMQDCELPRGLATNMDVGLACVMPDQQQLVFAGAKMSLYHSDGEQVIEVKGHRRPLLDRRLVEFSDTQIPLQPEHIYYLATDGYLDQAGGDKGFGLGNSRFCELLKNHATLPLAEQAQSLKLALEEYKGDFPQRDDITLLAFKVDSLK